VQITGLTTGLHRPRYVFGIDGFQALQLAITFAEAVIDSEKPKLVWVGDDSGREAERIADTKAAKQGKRRRRRKETG
jgi:hypothetical protein